VLLFPFFILLHLLIIQGNSEYYFFSDTCLMDAPQKNSPNSVGRARGTSRYALSRKGQFAYSTRGERNQK
jgi:hypothetical protein